MPLLRPDDFLVGQFISVHSYTFQLLPTPHYDMHTFQLIRNEPPPMPLIPKGVPLEILGISLPFITVAAHLGSRVQGPVIMDVRDSTFIALDPTYVASTKTPVTYPPPPKPPSPTDPLLTLDTDDPDDPDDT